MKLIDSSSWIHALRKSGDSCIRKRVQDLLLSDEAAWCHIIRVELWRGAKEKAEVGYLKELEANLTLLPLNLDVWNAACKLGQMCRKNGKPVPTTDIIIFACAITHEVEIEHCDKHMDTLLKLSSS